MGGQYGRRIMAEIYYDFHQRAGGERDAARPNVVAVTALTAVSHPLVGSVDCRRGALSDSN